MGTNNLDVGKVLEREGLLSHFLSPFEFEGFLNSSPLE